MNWNKLFYITILTSSIVHLVWGFYDVHEKNSVCNIMLQTAVEQKNSDLAGYLSQSQEPDGLCHSRYNGIKLIIDVREITDDYQS